MGAPFGGSTPTPTGVGAGASTVRHSRKSSRGDLGCSRGHRRVPLRGAGSMSNDPPPAIIPEAVHATGGARGFTSSEPCSTTSPPGSFPAAHVARTELNDRQPGTVPAASGPFSGLGWYSVAHPDTTPPTRQPFHRHSAAPHPRTGHSAHPAWSGHHTDKLPSVISHHLRYIVRTPRSGRRSWYEIALIGATSYQDLQTAQVAEAGGGRQQGAHPPPASTESRARVAPRASTRPGQGWSRGGSECRGVRTRSCSSRPPGVPFARFAGHRSARSASAEGPWAASCRSWSCGASWTPRAGHLGRRKFKIDERAHRGEREGAGRELSGGRGGSVSSRRPRTRPGRPGPG